MKVKDIKTTVSGLLVAIASFIVLNEQLKDYSVAYRISTFIVSGGVAFLGVSAKDSD